MDCAHAAFIFSCLSMRELTIVSQVCKLWYMAASRDKRWKVLCDVVPIWMRNKDIAMKNYMGFVCKNSHRFGECLRDMNFNYGMLNEGLLREKAKKLSFAACNLDLTAQQARVKRKRERKDLQQRIKEAQASYFQ